MTCLTTSSSVGCQRKAKENSREWQGSLCAFDTLRRGFFFEKAQGSTTTHLQLPPPERKDMTLRRVVRERPHQGLSRYVIKQKLLRKAVLGYIYSLRTCPNALP
jgi:hypothetical protein